MFVVINAFLKARNDVVFVFLYEVFIVSNDGEVWQFGDFIKICVYGSCDDRSDKKLLLWVLLDEIVVQEIELEKFCFSLLMDEKGFFGQCDTGAVIYRGDKHCRV